MRKGFVMVTMKGGAASSAAPSAKVSESAAPAKPPAEPVDDNPFDKGFGIEGDDEQSPAKSTPPATIASIAPTPLAPKKSSMKRVPDEEEGSKADVVDGAETQPVASNIPTLLKPKSISFEDSAGKVSQAADEDNNEQTQELSGLFGLRVEEDGNSADVEDSTNNNEKAEEPAQEPETKEEQPEKKAKKGIVLEKKKVADKEEKSEEEEKAEQAAPEKKAKKGISLVIAKKNKDDSANEGKQSAPEKPKKGIAIALKPVSKKIEKEKDKPKKEKKAAIVVPAAKKKVDEEAHDDEEREEEEEGDEEGSEPVAKKAKTGISISMSSSSSSDSAPVVRGKCKHCKKDVTTDDARLQEQEPPYDYMHTECSAKYIQKVFKIPMEMVDDFIIVPNKRKIPEPKTKLPLPGAAALLPVAPKKEKAKKEKPKKDKAASDDDEEEGDTSTRSEKKGKGEPKEKKPKKEKKDGPKRPLTSFMLFSSEMRSEVASEFPDYKTTQIASELGNRWKALDEDERKPYTEKAEQLKAEFLEMYPELDKEKKDKGEKKEKKEKIKKAKDDEEEVTEKKEKHKKSKKEESAEGEGKAKKEKKEKDGVKRPMSAYMLFANDKRSEVLSDFPDYKLPQVATELGNRWKALDEDSKKAYVEKAAELKAEFAEQHPELCKEKKEKSEKVKGEKKAKGKGKKASEEDGEAPGEEEVEVDTFMANPFEEEDEAKAEDKADEEMVEEGQDQEMKEAEEEEENKDKEEGEDEGEKEMEKSEEAAVEGDE